MNIKFTWFEGLIAFFIIVIVLLLTLGFITTLVYDNSMSNIGALLSTISFTLASAFISVVLTVTIVNFILNKGDEDSWAEISEIIFERINRVNVRVIANILKFLYPEFYINELAIDPKTRNDLMVLKFEGKMKNNAIKELEINEENIIKKIDNELSNRDYDAWQALVNNLNDIYTELNEIALNYNYKHNTKILKHLLELKNNLSSFIDYYNFASEQYFNAKNLTKHTVRDAAIILVLRDNTKNNLENALNHVIELDKLLKNETAILPVTIRKLEEPDKKINKQEIEIK